MQLYFFRHGLAQPNEDGSLLDHQRQLTLKGIEQTRIAARMIRGLKIRPSRLYSSPLIRARQTADIIGQRLDIAVEVRKEIGPGFYLPAVEDLIRDLGHHDQVMFVGHEPDFSQTISALIEGGNVQVKKGGLVRVDITHYHPLKGTLVWMLTPKLFRRMRY